MKAEWAHLSRTPEVDGSAQVQFANRVPRLLHRNKPLKAVRPEFVPLRFRHLITRPSQLLSSIALNNENLTAGWAKHGIFIQC